MRIELAIYGEVDRGHGLRWASGDRKIALELAQRLDLPDTAPPGVDWPPYLSGFPYQDRYVFARTQSDASAPRAGMVISHAVICPLEEIARVTDLRPILNLLSKNEIAKWKEGGIDLVLPREPPAESNQISDIAEALVARGRGPVVVVGCDAFEEKVIALWSHLWPEIRRTFGFRLSFGPGDLAESSPPSLICTPQSLSGKWTGYRIASSTEKALTLAGGTLIGHTRAVPLAKFIHAIGAKLSSFSDLNLAEAAYLQTLSVELDDNINALRLIERLAPSEECGQNFKQQLIDHICERLLQASPASILLLRNMSLNGFASARKLWDGVQQWGRTHPFSDTDDSGWVQIVSDSVDATAAVLEWTFAICAGLREATKTRADEFGAAFWRWVEIAPLPVLRFLATVPDLRTLETSLTTSVSEVLSTLVANAIVRFAVDRKLFRLSGVALAAAYDNCEAIKRQLAFDKGQADDGLRAVIARTSAKQALACALAFDEPRLARIGGELVVGHPAVFAGRDYFSLQAQKIWSVALEISPMTWSAPDQPRATVDQLLLMLLDGQPTYPPLFKNLAATPMADLCSFARRSEVWTRLDNERIRGMFLQATARGWLKGVERGEVTFKPDAALAAVLAALPEIDATLVRLRNDRFGLAVHVFRNLLSRSEAQFVEWLNGLRGEHKKIEATDATELGRLVFERAWRSAADVIARLCMTGHPDLEPAARLCLSMYGLITRFRLGLAPLSDEERWTLLESVAAELYPAGPDEAALWDRSGGKNAELDRSSTGRARWRLTIDSIRKGKGVGVERLIEEMLRDFPKNDLLQNLSRDNLFRSRHR